MVNKKYKKYPKGWLKYLKSKKKKSKASSKKSTTVNKPKNSKKVNKKPVRSNGEMQVFMYLRKNGILFEEQFSFDDCYNPRTSYKLVFDFYIPSLNTCIEFDGIQHFKYVKEFDGDDRTKLSKRQYRDYIKDEYCRSKGFKMIRIKYSDIGNVDSILDKVFSDGSKN